VWPAARTGPVASQAPLQPKTDYDKAGYAKPTFIALPSSHPREPLPSYHSQGLRVDRRRINIDDDQPPSGATSSASTASPERNKLSALSSSEQTATQVTSSSSAYPVRNIKSPYDRTGPLPDPTRQEVRIELHTP
jgi:hypothetical protein